MSIRDREPDPTDYLDSPEWKAYLAKAEAAGAQESLEARALDEAIESDDPAGVRKQYGLPELSAADLERWLDGELEA